MWLAQFRGSVKRHLTTKYDHIEEIMAEFTAGLKDAFFEMTGMEGCKAVIPLKERLLIQYGDQIADKSTMAKMVGTNKAYSMAKTPVIASDKGVSPAVNHRVVVDDIGWGLCVLLSIAERLELADKKVPTSMITFMIEWFQRIMGKEYVVDGRLLGRDVDELVLLGPEDPLSLVGSIEVVRGDSVLKGAEEERYGNP